MSARTLYLGPAVTVTFKDQGQDFLEWDIKDGKVVASRPFQAFVWCGREVHSTPEPKKQIRIKGHDGKLAFIKYPLVKVKLMPPEPKALGRVSAKAGLETQGLHQTQAPSKADAEG